MAATDDFFGGQYLGVNPYGAEASDRMNRLSTLDQMFQSWFQPTGGTGSNKASLPQGSQTNAANATGCPDPGPPPTNCQYGYYLASGGSGGCPYWTCNPDPGGNVPGGSGPSGPGTNLPPNNPGSPGQGTGVQNPGGGFTGGPAGYTGGGSSAAGGYTGMYGSLPPELAQLRSGLSSFLLGQMGQRFPMYGGNLNVSPDPNAMSAANLFSSGAGQANIMGSQGLDMIQQLFGYRAPNAAMPNFSQIMGGTTPDAASALMALGQKGSGDVGNYLNYGSGIINAALANNPFLSQNLNLSGTAGAQFGQAANLAQTSAGGPFTGGTSAFLDPITDAYRNIATTGNAPDIGAALRAIEQRGQLAITDDLAGIREQYGARGLGAGSDVAAALAQGAARGRADITAQQSTLQADVLNQAANRMVSAQGLAPSLAGAYADPMAQWYQRQAQASGLMSQIGQGTTGLMSAGSMAGTGMQDSLTRMAGVLGDYGRTSADATQAGTSALAAAGNLQSGSFDRILQALGMQSQHSLGQGQLANQAAGVQGQALSTLPGLLNSMTGATTTGAGGMLDVAKYMSTLQSGNIDRNWQNFNQGQQYPFLNPAISFMTSMPQSQQQMPIVQGNNADSMWGSAASGMVTALMMAGMFSSRDFKHVLHKQMNSLWFAKAVQKLPVSMWYYKGMTPEQTHVGPMAEDFKALYAVGDGITISYIDAIGILFATVQGLSKAIERLSKQLMPLEDVYA